MGQFISWDAIAEKSQLVFEIILIAAIVVLTIIGLSISIPTLWLADKLSQILDS
tara:strand:+ start:627 stop:788 length:162 start_codon:yes stop_codon:yes gene_type:complete